MPTFKETVSIGWEEGPYKKTLSKEELKVLKIGIIKLQNIEDY